METKLFIVLANVMLTVSAQTCPELDGYFFADNRQCDRYIACKDGYATDHLCPDGLLFNALLGEKSSYPCSYPTEVDCGGRTEVQPARPTQHCAHAWGYFGSGDSKDCGTFWNCVDGREFGFSCPEGLAFSSYTYRCEYPENSPECDVEAYLGFSCPAQPDLAQVAIVGIPRYASPRDCRKYFLCVDLAPRLQTCELGLVFNDEIHVCDEPENVRGCQNYYPADELAEIRERKERKRIAAERRRQEYRDRFARLNEGREHVNVGF